MKNLLRTCLLVLICSSIGRSQITSGEYFWDIDPGINLATPIPASVFVGVTNDTYSFSPTTTGISPGIHRLFFRLKDNAGNLSQIVSQVVYIGQTGIPTIADDQAGLLEYYWDENSASPTQVTLTNPPIDGIYNFTVPSTGLIAGSHKLHMRIKDKFGLWSGYYSKSILIFGTSPLPNIQKIEYYVDTDLGEGLNTSVSFTPLAAADVTSSFEIPTVGLTNGQHVATMRVQDVNGLWSGKISKAFNLDPQFTLTAGALTGQYYCLGGTIEVPITRTGTWPTENEYILELSDNTGNNFVPIPTATSFGGSGDKLIGTIPSNLMVSGGYRIRAVTTLPYIRRESNTIFTIGISATANVNTPICANGTLNFTSTSSTAATYSWSGPASLSAVQNPTLNSAQVAASGNYIVTATNTGGCTATASIAAVVNPNPTPNAGADVTICAGNSMTIGSAAISGNTYSWSPSTGLSNAAIANPIASPAATSSYVLTMTTTATGCTATDNIVVTVNPNPTPNAGADVTICAGNSMTIGSAAISGNTYSWSPSTGLSNATIANPVASPAATSTYVVTMTTTATGCTATDNIVVTVNPNPTPNAGANVSICAGNGITIGSAAVFGNTYSWNPSTGLSNASIANPVASPAATTTYVVTMTTTATSCTATDNVIVTVNPKPNLITHTQIIGVSGFVNLTLASVTSGSVLPPGTTLGYFTNLAGTIPLNNPSNVTAVGVYYIKATSLSGCVSIVSVTVIDGGCPSSFSLVNPLDNAASGVTYKISSGSIAATNRIIGTANYTIDAKTNITLSPGFIAGGTGVVFLAKIDGCVN